MEKQADQLAPNSREAEQALIGAMLINPEFMPFIASFLSRRDFFWEAHAIVWDAMLAIQERNEGIDMLTLADELEVRKQLADLGNGMFTGRAFLTFLTGQCETHYNAETYARLVERCAIRRRGISAAENIAGMFWRDERELPDIIEQAHDVLNKATHIKANGDFTAIGEHASRVYDQIEDRYRNGGLPAGIPTGFKELDEMLWSQGLAKGELTLIAARPGMGKTALMLNIGRNIGKRGLHVAMLSMEMNGDQLAYRLLALESGINSKKLVRGNLDDREWARLTAGVEGVDKLGLQIDASGRLSIRQLTSKTERLNREYGIDVLFVDYIQLMASDKRTENRNMEISEISRGLKQLAMTLNIPVLAASQLNRKLEDRADKMPQLSDLRESGSLEQDADTVIFIHRDDKYNEHSERPGQADLIFAKQRQGETGKVILQWIDSLTKFKDWEGTRVDLSNL